MSRRITPKPNNRMIIYELRNEVHQKELNAFKREVDPPEFKEWYRALNKLRAFLAEMKRTNAKWEDTKE